MTDKKVKLGIIINPYSGIKKKRDMVAYLSKKIDSEKYDTDYILTKHKGHAKELAREFIKAGKEIIVAVGGDGTINEVASSLINTNCTLSIIPVGSGNGFARSLNIPLKVKDAIKIIENGKIKTIDCGVINKYYFFCTCGVGFDAHIGKMFDKAGKRGVNNYVKTTFNEFWKYKSKKYTLYVDGETIKLKAFLITIANGPQYGNNAYIAPGALIDDGLLDVVIVKPFPKSSSVSLGVKLFNKKFHKSRYVESIKCKKIIILRKKRNKIHVDGEPFRSKKKLKVSIIPDALKVLIP